VVRALLAAGADPSQRGEFERLPYEEAAINGYDEVPKLLQGSKPWPPQPTEAVAGASELELHLAARIPVNRSRPVLMRGTQISKAS